ncbi:MAG: hypothetical protein U0S50_13200 [Sphingopyxis sp.]|uniref:hypothetical protein n=1 Tax=Sphingopyxis sp. TaxID=1908224 RepID=UPI002AB99B42|nr:hypothetical protein [Sphingopyxis sp.]MDZ3832753.1 hypothetical protein [Sphingopyxis sp.]
MRAAANPASVRSNKSHLFDSCAIAASLAALALGGPALAQVAGTGTVVGGSAIISPPTTPLPLPPNTTQVEVSGAQTIINWTPTDGAATGGAIDFLPVGSALEFYGPGDYTVLNRFVDGGGGSISRQVALNGTVNSYVGTRFSTGGNVQGGNIWFYNAGGILIGSTGVINVGSLVLTANDIDTTGPGGLLGPGGEIRFRGASGSTAAVQIDAGARINATGVSANSSYVALVAPRVVQRGAVSVDGSAALVAAEQADVLISNGLFDINVQVGAEGGTVIDHSGSTTGPEQNSGNSGGIYLVAIPKNDAVTMLVSGQLGYDDASSVTLDNGRVVLSAGHNITGGAISAAPASTAAASIVASDTIVHSNLFARASGSFTGGPRSELPDPSGPAQPAHIGRFTVEGDALINAAGSATFTVGTNQEVDVSGALTIQSDGPTGNAAVAVNGGQFSVGGLFIRADDIASTGNAQGGTASYTQTGGSASIGAFLVSADGIGSSLGGSGSGGTATVDIAGGTLTSDEIHASAAGIGGMGLDGFDSGSGPIIPAGNGGDGTGGDATITIAGNAVVNTADVSASARGVGGNGGSFSTSFLGGPGNAGNGGSGNGGSAAIRLLSGSLVAGDTISVSASGEGGLGGNRFDSSSSGSATSMGAGGNGGSADGGSAVVEMFFTPDFAGTLEVSALATGGAGGSGNDGGNGGDAFGGSAGVVVDSFDAGDVDFSLDVRGIGGNGSDGFDGRGGNGGEGSGGSADIDAFGPNARVSTGAAQFAANGQGGNGGNAGLGFFSSSATPPAGGNGGDSFGGAITIRADDGATIALASSSGDIQFDSGGTAGNGGNGAANESIPGLTGGAGGNAGRAIGGRVFLIASGGTIDSNGAAVTINVNSVAGNIGIGGIGTAGNGANGTAQPTRGGQVVIDARTPAGQVVLGDTIINASGDNAGRIDLSAEGSISMASLSASTQGFAPPTGIGGVGESFGGILLSPDGGTISTTGNMQLISGGAIGIFASGDGNASAGGNILIQAADRVDIRRTGGTNIVPTASAGGTLTINAVNGLTAIPTTQLNSAAAMSLSVSNGAIDVDRLIGGNISVISSGAASVEHAESDTDFFAAAASFRTGLNSIITGGNIIISSPGAVDLGNSSAGGLVSISGQSITFNSVSAGTGIDMTASGTVAGAEGISGGTLTAGTDISLTANSLSLTGAANGGGSLFAFGLGGPVAIAQANMGGTISIFSAGDLTGNYISGGDIRLNSDANVTVSAQANGGYIDSSTGLTADGNLLVDAVGDVTLTNSGAARMFGVNAGQNVSINGGSAGEDMLVLAAGNATLTSISAGDDVDVSVGGDISATNVSATAVGPDTADIVYTGNGFFITTSAADGADINFSTSGTVDAANLSAGDDISIFAGTALSLDGATTLGLGVTGGDSSIGASGDGMALANLNAFDNIFASASGTVAITAPIIAGANVTINADAVTMTTLAAPTDTVSAGGDALIEVGNDISGGRVAAAGGATLSAGGAIGVESVTANNVAISGAGGVAATRVTSIGTATLTSSGGNMTVDTLNAGGAVDASGNAVTIGNSGNLAFSNLVATTGDARVNTTGTLSVANANVAGTADLRSGGDLSISSLSAANAQLASTAGAMTLTDLSVTGTLNANAQGLMRVDGTLAAPTIALTSGDIDVTATGQAGADGTTTSLILTNGNGAVQTFIGGTGTRSGYHIDAAELARLYGSQIRIVAPDVTGTTGIAAEPDAVIDDFTLTGGISGSNLGTNGSFTIQTAGKARVIGDVRLTGITSGNSFAISGNEAVEVILGDGSIRMTDASGAIAGQLNLAGQRVSIATLAAIADVAAATSTNAIETRLAQNDGVVIDDGALYASGISAAVGEGFYVQNSGATTATADRRGLTFGALGLDVQTSTPARIVASGVQIGPSGQVTGADALALLTVNGVAPVVGAYDPQSRFNGCLIANPAICGPVQPVNDPLFPVQDVIEDKNDPDDGEKSKGRNLPNPLITMRDVDPMTGEPLLDDPVTGAGNDDLWTPPAD